MEPTADASLTSTSPANLPILSAIEARVLDAFTAEYGVKVTYLTYESSREASANIRAGREYDVIVIDHPYVPELAATGLQAKASTV